ncbi:hypothetical protein IG631_16620 [Alternaria alternata]|nr:hypothetical protein IG631_16620 [Alternaria alternata]
MTRPASSVTARSLPRWLHDKWVKGKTSRPCGSSRGTLLPRSHLPDSGSREKIFRLTE